MLRSAVVEKTSDGKDYKVSFSKAAAARLEAPAPEAVTEPMPAVTINHYQEKDPLRMQAEEVVALFHRIFHGVQNHYPLSKETDQALALITQHGLEQTRHIIEFAHSAAAASGFAPQTFGGILQYSSRGIVDFDRARQKDTVVDKREQTRPLAATESADLRKGIRRLQALTREQHQVRLEAATAALCRQSQAMARLMSRQNSIAEKMIRSRMLRQLEEEPMDLLPLYFLPDWANNRTQNFEI